MIIQKAREAFPNVDFPLVDKFYTAYMQKWINIFENRPSWRTCKAGGLHKRGERPLNLLNTGKILCDLLANKCFSEQFDVICDKEEYKTFLDGFLNREGFWKNIPPFLSKGFSRGGFVLREYIEDGKVKINYVDAENFIPLKWDNQRIIDGIFCSCSFSGGNYYTLFERSRFDDKAHTENYLFQASSPNDLGVRVPLSELYGDMRDSYDFDVDVPLFQYFRSDFSCNIPDTNIPLGISCYANAVDTLKALDVAFDSFAREFVLGKKRIIVPSSCIRTVVDPDTGEVSRYFDADDEVYQALKCDDDKDLRITDNTVMLRIAEHVDGINAFLNILCAQVGLSPGSLAFDKAEGVKTATEIISEENKTAETVKGNKNLLVETFEEMCHAALKLAVWSGELTAADYELTVSFKDNVIVDDNTIIDNNIKLVAAGLKPKIDAIMEVLKCDEKTARKKLAQIRIENAAEFETGGKTFDPSERI